MEYVWWGIIFIFGSIVGSFLNVVIYRLHTGKSLNGRSHCMSCNKLLSWFELFPVVSYIALRGKCKGCSSYIPSRYLSVEVLTGLLFMLVWYTSASDMFLLALNLILISILVIITVYDMRHTIIPDEMSLSVGMVAVLLLGYTYTVHKDIYEVLWNVVAGLGAGGFFAGLWYISKGRWIGLGDAKLALPLGIIAGLGGVFSMVVLSFWIGALISLTLLGLIKILKRGKTGLHFLSLPLTIKSEIPFAPFLVASFLLVYFFQTDIFTITYALFFW